MATTPTDTGALVEQGTPLARNHWFDGKFLRADDLARDQDYHRSALRLANQAGGYGVVRGLEVALSGAQLVLQPGLAITPDGELLLLSSELAVGVDAVIAATAATASSANLLTASAIKAGRVDTAFKPCVPAAEAAAVEPVAGGLRLYRLTLGPYHALCGFEDVVGALCERACVTERQRPYQLDGVRLRARAQALALPELKGIEAGGRHARSRIASALFALEDGRIAPLPDDGGRLLSPLWCAGADMVAGSEVTLGYLVRGAGVADFIDLWAGRRERMAAQAQGYWQRRTRLRPFAEFIAQVAQFQCQLASLFRDGAPPVDEGGDCESLRSLVTELQQQLKDALKPEDGSPVGATEWTHATSAPVMKQLGRFVTQAVPLLKGRPDRVLLERGIVELPPAGFLPVVPASGDVLAQVQRLVGPGVLLQLCSAPLDAIGHLFEEAQHSARTSLTRGLADPADKPRLQVIVPDGEAQATAPVVPPGYEVAMQADAATLVLMLASALKTKSATPVAGAGAAPGPAPATVAATVAATTAAAPPAMAAAAAGLANNFAAAGANTVNAASGATRATIDSTAFASASSVLRRRLETTTATLAAEGTVADGAGRVLDTAGQAPGFALAALGRATGAGGNTAANEFEACWIETHAAQDPFAVAPGASVALQLELVEADRPGANMPAGAKAGWLAALQGRLVLDPDPKNAEDARATIEAITGVVGGELRLAALRDGVLRWSIRVQGLPGVPDGTMPQDDVAFGADTVVLQRLGTGGAARWLVAIPVQLDTGNGGTVVVVMELLPQAGATSALQMRLLSFDPRALGMTTRATMMAAAAVATPTPTATRVVPLATLRADALALAAGAAPRVAAEAAFKRLSDDLGDAAPNTAARQRLLGDAVAATPATGMKAVHDWVLFRRPVDARCTLQAVVPAPAPAPTPVPVPVPPPPTPVPVPVPTPPPPVPAPVANHRQRVLLLRQEAVSVLTQLGGASAFASRAEAMLKQLETMRVGYYELGFVLDGTSVTVLSNADSDLAGLTAAAQARGGLGSNNLPVLMRATDDTGDKRSNAARAAAALFDKLFGPGANTQVVICNPTPSQIQSQHDALTILFTKG